MLLCLEFDAAKRPTASQLVQLLETHCRKLAELGDPVAQFNLARWPEEKHGQATAWYRKAAEQGHAIAQCTLAGFYLAGIGVERDDRLASQWFRKAAEQGIGEAQFHLALLLIAGADDSRASDFTEAVMWLQKAQDDAETFERARRALEDVLEPLSPGETQEVIRDYARGELDGCRSSWDRRFG